MDHHSFLRWKVEDRIATVRGDQLAGLGDRGCPRGRGPRSRLYARAPHHAHSSPILATAKRSLNTVESMSLRSGYIFEQSLTGEISGHPDTVEAVWAAPERRAPSYPPRGSQRARQ
jgi:hypothetical protein